MGGFSGMSEGAKGGCNCGRCPDWARGPWGFVLGTMAEPILSNIFTHRQTNNSKFFG